MADEARAGGDRGDDPAVRDARPPAALIAVLNPVLRIVLATPLGRLVGRFALLELRGRRSGRRYRIPVGWHRTSDGPAVFTPAPWRANLTGGVQVRACHRGRWTPWVATLDRDPAAVAAALRSMVDLGGSLTDVGIRAPKGHSITAAEVARVDRALIRLDPMPPPA